MVLLFFLYKDYIFLFVNIIAVSLIYWLTTNGNNIKKKKTGAIIIRVYTLYHYEPRNLFSSKTPGCICFLLLCLIILVVLAVIKWYVVIELLYSVKGSVITIEIEIILPCNLTKAYWKTLFIFWFIIMFALYLKLYDLLKAIASIFNNNNSNGIITSWVKLNKHHVCLSTTKWTSMCKIVSSKPLYHNRNPFLFVHALSPRISRFSRWCLSILFLFLYMHGYLRTIQQVNESHS